MDVAAISLIGIGLAIMCASGIWYLIVAFRKSMWWGLANMFLPVAGIAFLVAHPKLAWKPFAASSVGTIVAFVGIGCYMGAHPELTAQDPIAATMEKGQLPIEPDSNTGGANTGSASK